VRLGVDLDNTLIDYDHVFVKEARERGLVDQAFSRSKQSVRDSIRLLPEGELAWQRLQGYVYGRGFPVPAVEGAREFLRRCRERSIPVYIVSHKTRYGNHDPDRVDLREAALGWLRKQGFFEPGEASFRPRTSSSPMTAPPSWRRLPRWAAPLCRRS